MPASELKPNPRNWRTHSTEQSDALRGVLAEVGIADAVLVRETDDGLELIDGHLRAETLGGEPIPVLVLDVTREEADKILVTLDPLAAMAGRDDARLMELLGEIETESDGLQAMLDGLRNEAESAVRDNDSEGESYKEQFCILIDCENEIEQARLLERFQSEGIQCRALIS